MATKLKLDVRKPIYKNGILAIEKAARERNKLLEATIVVSSIVLPSKNILLTPRCGGAGETESNSSVRFKCVVMKAITSRKWLSSSPSEAGAGSGSTFSTFLAFSRSTVSLESKVKGVVTLTPLELDLGVARALHLGRNNSASGLEQGIRISVPFTVMRTAPTELRCNRTPQTVINVISRIDTEDSDDYRYMHSVTRALW